MSGKNAVVLLSGGLDSTTVLAIAQSEGYVPYALSFRYGQRHAAELDAARRIAAAAGVAGHVVAEIDLRVFGGSALTADIEVPKGRSDERDGRRASRSPTCRRATRSSSPSRSPGPRRSEASDIFVGVNALDYSGYPDCRPEYIEAFERMANLATKAGVEGTQRLADPRAADAAHEGGHHPPRARAGRRLLRHAELLRPRRRRAAPAARATPACCGCAASPPSACPIPRPTSRMRPSR